MLKKITILVPFLFNMAYAADVKLTWTATGDDGDVGTAAAYDLRYSTDSMVLVNWVSAVQAVGEPLPKPSGSPESFVLTGIPDPSIAAVFIAIKVRDEAFNWSPLSNIVNTRANDTIPPSTIMDLRIIP